LVDAHQMKVQMFRYTQAWDLQPGCNYLSLSLVKQ